VIANKAFWDGLPGDIRGQLEKAMAESTAYANEIALKENTDALDAMKASGKITLYTPTEAELKEWIIASKPVQDEMAGRVGKELIDSIRNAAK
jgi:C4-dicarboxylate-binding protein DctP